MEKQDRRLQYYGIDSFGKRRIMSYYVNDKKDAQKALGRFAIPSGWYVVRDLSGMVILNERIYK